MAKRIKDKKTPVPKEIDLIVPTYKAFKSLGDNLSTKVVYDFVVDYMGLPNDILEIMQVNKDETELWYNLKWVRTDMGKAKILTKNHRNCWSLRPVYREIEFLDQMDIDRTLSMKQVKKKDAPEEFSVGVNLKCILRRFNISSAELSDSIDVPETDVAAWINMNKIVPITMVSHICKFLGISPYYLLTGDSTESELNEDEKELIMLYRCLSESSKGRIKKYAEMVSKQN